MGFELVAGFHLLAPLHKFRSAQRMMSHYRPVNSPPLTCLKDMKPRPSLLMRPNCHSIEQISVPQIGQQSTAVPFTAEVQVN